MSTSYETWEFKEFVSAFKKDIKDILKPYIDKIYYPQDLKTEDS